MRLCFVCGEYPPGPHGGIGTVTATLARALVREGHGVRVIGSCRGDYPGPDRANDQGVDVWRLREPPGRFGWARARMRLFATLAGWSRRGELDLVETPDYAGNAAYWPPLAVPVVVRVHGSVSYFAAELGQPAARGLFRMERAALRRADAWCAVSRYAARRTGEIFGLAGGSPAVLYNPIELPEGEWPVRSRHDVVFAGTLTAKKGVLPLADAWPRVLTASPDARLHVCGKDMPDASGRSMTDALRERLGDAAARVTFHGHLPRAELLQLLRRARAAVFPSFAEAFAMAPLEAMAAGAPTIYSARGSGGEIIEHDRTGVLIDPDEPQQIADAITRVLTGDALAARIGAAGQQHVAEHFSIGTVVRDNEAFYERCVHDFPRMRAWRPGSLQPVPPG
jgi:glycosyltransferase involved in cell wall biosynthesis